MKKVAAKMGNRTTKTAQNTKDTGDTRNIPGEGSGLAYRYKQIGISAVAAAVRYQGTAKNPAYAPAPMNWRDTTGESAA
jgi:hypothetical protein